MWSAAISDADGDGDGVGGGKFVWVLTDLNGVSRSALDLTFEIFISEISSGLNVTSG